MRKLALAAFLAAFASAAWAGNLAVFEEPAEVAPEEPMGGSNAAWLIPLIAIIAIAAASSGNDSSTPPPSS